MPKDQGVQRPKVAPATPTDLGQHAPRFIDVDAMIPDVHATANTPLQSLLATKAIASSSGTISASPKMIGYDKRSGLLIARHTSPRVGLE